MARPIKNTDYIKVTVEVPRDLYQKFQRIHPVHGAFTQWLRRALRLHIEGTLRTVEQLIGADSE